MEVRSLAQCGCVFVCMYVGVCVCVGIRPSESGKHCHSYVNKPDSRDRPRVGRFLWGEGWKMRWMEKDHCSGEHFLYMTDGLCTSVCESVPGGLCSRLHYGMCVCVCTFVGPV